MDKDGKAYWHESKPCRMLHQWFHRSDSRYKAIGDSSFDATDWQNSLIKRPEKALEVTMADLEKKFGCKVKIVKEN